MSWVLSVLAAPWLRSCEQEGLFVAAPPREPENAAIPSSRRSVAILQRRPRSGSSAIEVGEARRLLDHPQR